MNSDAGSRRRCRGDVGRSSAPCDRRARAAVDCDRRSSDRRRAERPTGRVEQSAGGFWSRGGLGEQLRPDRRASRGAPQFSGDRVDPASNLRRDAGHRVAIRPAQPRYLDQPSGHQRQRRRQEADRQHARACAAPHLPRPCARADDQGRQATARVCSPPSVPARAPLDSEHTGVPSARQATADGGAAARPINTSVMIPKAIADTDRPRPQ